MRRALVLVMLIMTMLAMAQLVEWVQAGQGLSDFSSFYQTLRLGTTFASIGFVIIAASVAGSLVGNMSLPRVTGYIVAGIALGPYVLNVLSFAVVEDMKIFNTLAVALIALEAGLELRIASIRKVAKSLLAIVLYKVPLSWLMIGGAFLLASPLMPEAAGELTLPMLVSIALVLGSLGVGTSPAVSIAVISEMQAKGKTADTILSLAIFKDLVMIVMLAVSMAVSNVLLTEGAEMDPMIFLVLGKKVFLSLLAGAAIGGLLIAYIKWVRWELILIILIVAYGGVHLADAFHLKALLIFIGAGFVVTNFSPYGHELHASLAFLALPVFIIFFTTAGAGLNLDQAWQVLPVAGILYVVRAAMMFIAVRLGGLLAGDPKAFSNNLWLGTLSQAGVALGLLFIAMEELPQIALPLEMVALALIALNLLTGPIFLRLTLGRGAAIDKSEMSRGPRRRLSLATGEGVRRLVGQIQARTRAVEVPDDDRLKAFYDEVAEELNTQVRSVKQTVFSSWADAAERRSWELLSDHNGPSRSFHEVVAPIEMRGHAEQLRRACRHLRDRLADLPGKSVHPLLVHHGKLPADASLGQRVTWLSQRMRGGVGRAKRRVGVRLVARSTVEGVLVPCLAAMLVDLVRTEATRIELLDRMNRDAHELESEEQREALIRERLKQIELFCQEATGMLHNTLDAARQRCLEGLGHALRYAATPMMRSRELRYVNVAARVDASIKILEREGAYWDRMLEGVSGRARVRSVLLDIESALDWEMHALVRRWAGGPRADVLARIALLRSQLESEMGRLGASLGALSVQEQGELVAEVALSLEQTISEQVLPSVEALRQDETGFASLGHHVNEWVERLDETWLTVPHDFHIYEHSRPDLRVLASVSLRSIARKFLVMELDWAFDEADARAERLNDRVALRLGEVAAVVAYGLKSAGDELRAEESATGAEAIEIAVGSLGRAAKLATSMAGEIEANVSSTPDAIRGVTHEAFLHTYQRALGESRPEGGRNRASQQGRLVRILRGGEQRVRWLGEVISRQVVVLVSRVLESEAARDARVRVGLEQVTSAEMARDVRAFEPSQSQLEKLPYVLTKLFDPSALDTPQILVGATGPREHLGEAWRRYQGGRSVTVLLKGAAGSGKTSVAHVVLRRLTERRLIELRLGPVERNETGFCASLGAESGAFEARTFEQLTRHLRSDRRVVLLDGFEQIFERTLSGLRHVRAVLKLVANTQESVCWVISINTPTARLLSRICDLRAFFTDEIFFGPLGHEDVFEVIDARCRLSGFNIGWPDGRDNQASMLHRMFQPRDDEARRRRYCQRVAEAAHGNIRNALTLVVNGIERVEDETIFLAHVPTPRIPWFEQLGRDAHRVLALVVLTGSTAREEARSSIRWAPERLDAALSRLTNGGALVPMVDHPERWELRPGIWPSVVRELEARNILMAGGPL